MKRADLITGEHYAYNIRRTLGPYSGAHKVMLLSTELHTSHVVRGGPNVISLAKSGERANTGSWSSGPTGLLMRDDAGEEFIAQPANLHMTWEDYLAWVEQAQAETEQARVKERERQAKIRTQTSEIAKALLVLGLRDTVRLDLSTPNQAISNDALLAILRHAAAPEFLAKVLDQENDRALKLRDDATSNGSGSNNNLRAQGRHDGYAAGVRFAASLLRGNPHD